MRVVLYGEGDEEGSGAWCYAETLRDLGHEVRVFGDRTVLESYERSLPLRVLRGLSLEPWPPHRERHARELMRLVRRFRPSVVIVLKGLLLGAEDIRAMKDLGAWTVNVNHDDFFSRNPHNWSRRQRGAIPEYDFIFTTREVNVEEVRPLNPRVEFFPFAYYPRIHRPVPVEASEREAFTSDVVFVGTWERERCGLLEELVRRVPARYAIWGTQWERVSPGSPLVPHVRRRQVIMDDMAKALGGAKIALAFLRKENRDDYTQRSFEIPACGGVLVGERTERHRRFYQEGVEAEFFAPDSVTELEEKVVSLLADAPRRESMRTLGREALLRQRHTYRDRLELLFSRHEANENRAQGASAGQKPQAV